MSDDIEDRPDVYAGRLWRARKKLGPSATAEEIDSEIQAARSDYYLVPSEPRWTRDQIDAALAEANKYDAPKPEWFAQFKASLERSSETKGAT